MANKDSLKPFKKGDPRASEAGKKSKRGPSIITRLKSKLQENPEEIEEIVNSILKHSKDGDARYTKIVVEYLDGKVKDEIDIKGEITNYNLDKKEYLKARKRMLESDDC